MEERVKYLVSQFQSGQLATAEKTELLNLIEEHPTLVSDEIADLLKAFDSEQESVALHKPEQDRWNLVVNRILSVDKPNVRRKYLCFNHFKLAAAAVLLIGLATTLYFYHDTNRRRTLATDIAPGGNKAILTLANGRKISLNDIANGELIKEAGLSISKTANGQLVYNIEKVGTTADDQGVNVISTPNGGEWQIRLPDGSTVWLNAASSLEYPINIGSTPVRKVRLKGEAYFEVAKDSKHPFVVETPEQKLEVLGTHFNVNSYADEHITKTTLLEGSIRISDVSNTSASEMLKPGQQSVLSSTGIRINDVDTDESIAWKNGYFMFNNERQESIMRKIARWYNVKVEYADPEARDVVYYGTVSRFDKISQVLRKFEQTGEVRFEIEKDKLTIFKK